MSAAATEPPGVRAAGSPTAAGAARSSRPEATDPRRFALGLALLSLAALAGRVAYALLTFRHDHDLVDEGDAFFYSVVAGGLADGHWFSKFTGIGLATGPAHTTASPGCAPRASSRAAEGASSK